jgi:hypothetical protein
MAGAAKPGSTLPPQGGKGGVQSPRPALAPPGQGSTLPPQGGKGGAQPGQVPPRTLGGYSPADIDRLMANQVPAQVQQPAPGQVPAQGGKAQNPDGTYTGTLPGYAQPYVNDLFSQRPGQVPAQGGKAPLTPEQHAAISNNADPARGLGLNLGSMLYGGGGQQLAPGQVAPTQAEIDRLRPMLTTPMAQTPSNLSSYTQPAYNDLMTQDKAAKLAEMERMRAGQVPAPVQQSNQAGQAEKLAYMQSVLNASRPQVQQPAPVMPRPAMPRLTRPTMPRPSSIGAGLAALRGRR